MTNKSASEHQTRRRRLWPWVVLSLVLCLFAAGFSLWWPIHKANQLLESSGVTIIPHRPPLIAKYFGWIDFLPWYDKLHRYTKGDAITDSQLRELCQYSTLSEVSLDISYCSPENIEKLQALKYLIHLDLRGGGKEIPLDAITSLVHLQYLRLDAIPVRSHEWSRLLNLPYLDVLHISDRQTSASHGGPQSYATIYLERDHLTRADAESLNAIADLEKLELYYSTSEAEFWETLGRSQTLKFLGIHALSSTSSLSLTQTELGQIQKIATLTDLSLLFNSSAQVEVESSAWETFRRNRPDVSAIKHSVRY